MKAPDGRPIYLDLLKIKLPMPALISIMHRGFGIVLSFSIPFFAYLMAISLQSHSGFNLALEWLNSSLLLPVYALLLWGFIHHLLAGIRYLLIDVEIGVSKETSFFSSQMVFFGSIVIAILVLLGFWL